MTRLNVLYLTLNPNRVSTTVATEGWMTYLPVRGLKPVLVSRTCGDLHRWAVAQSIPAYQNDLPFPHKYMPYPFLRSLWKLWKIAKRHNIQLIHCNEQDIYPIGQYLGRICRVPVVVTVHFTLPAEFAKWAFGGNRQPDRMFFVSARNQLECQSAVSGIVDCRRQQVLHNGIDLRRYQPDIQLRKAFRDSVGLVDEDIAIGVACALRPRKQLEHFFQAMARLASPRTKCFIAGSAVDGDEDYAQDLICSAKNLLGHRLRILGHIDDLRPFCNGLDIFVNTSREESFGIAPLEAMACGCPVVGYDSKAVDEVVLPDGGEITPQDDLDTLVATLESWIADPDLGLRRPRARQQAMRFDLRHLSDRLWEEYQKILFR